MGGSSSSSRRKQVVATHSKVGAASVPVTIYADEDYLDSSTSSDGEWDDLPPFPANLIGKTSKCHYVLKLLFVGNCDTGKSQLLQRFAEDFFSDNYISTIGIDFKIRTITMDERRFKLQIWDTAGQERFRTITRAYFRGAHGIFLVYNAQYEASRSFDLLHKWLYEIQENASPDIHLTLLGNKSDLKEEDEGVDYLKAKKFADEHGMAFFEVSAKDGTNVELAVTNMVARIWRTMIKQNSSTE